MVFPHTEFRAFSNDLDLKVKFDLNDAEVKLKTLNLAVHTCIATGIKAE